MKQEVITVDAKHVFLDIVRYTHNRSVEAQTELISILNEIVVESIEVNEVDNKNVLFIPTGDGICISLINVLNPYDIHLNIGLTILKKLYEYNNSITDTMRQFSVRIGINENIDNLIIDINGHKNISGSGINFAARILTLCDTSQIIVGNSVFEKLVQREKYMESFASFSGEVKHDFALEVHQFLDKSLTYLNNDTPSKFVTKPRTQKKLDKLVGYYFAHCIANEDSNIEKIKQGSAQCDYSLRVLTFYLAEDSVAKSKATKTDPGYRKKMKRSVDEQFKYLQTVDFWLICDLSEKIISNLEEFSQYFSDKFLFINKEGRKKLKKDHPEICKELKI